MTGITQLGYLGISASDVPAWDESVTNCEPIRKKGDEE